MSTPQPTPPRIGRAVICLGIADLLILVSLALPWLSYQGELSVGAFDGPGLLTFFAWIGMTAVFVVQLPAVEAAIPLRSVTQAGDRVIMIGGAIELIGIVIFYPHYHSIGVGASRSIEFGYVVALFGSLLTIVAGLLWRSERSAGWQIGALPSTPPPPAPGPPPPPAPRSRAAEAGEAEPFVPRQRGSRPAPPGPPPPPPPPSPRGPAGDQLGPPADSPGRQENRYRPPDSPPPPPPPGPR